MAVTRSSSRTVHNRREASGEWALKALVILTLISPFVCGLLFASKLAGAGVVSVCFTIASLTSELNNFLVSKRHLLMDNEQWIKSKEALFTTDQDYTVVPEITEVVVAQSPSKREADDTEEDTNQGNEASSDLEIEEDAVLESILHSTGIIPAQTTRFEL